MNKKESEILAIAVIKELNNFNGFNHWWDMIDEHDRLIILMDIATILCDTLGE